MPIPSQWPRTLSVLGIGCSLLLALGLLDGSILPTEAPQNVLKANTAFAPLNSFLGVVWLFAAYVVGEVCCIVGLVPHKRDKTFLKRYAMVLFSQNDPTGFWQTKLYDAERRFEMLRGLACASLVFGVVAAVHFALGAVWIEAGLYFAGGVGITFLLVKIAQDSFQEIEATMDQIIEFREAS